MIMALISILHLAVFIDIAQCRNNQRCAVFARQDDISVRIFIHQATLQ